MLFLRDRPHLSSANIINEFRLNFGILRSGQRKLTRRTERYKLSDHRRNDIFEEHKVEPVE